ncbi:cell wall hydrolase/autolysin [Hymenobacter roseosalivarius DSM 11622]|uniref:N-acetylmuramoyl-L-alanine amidase n=1 Tax=Hymenobacter roseosalivarius DSM 11622 TaxID=645990 RepID=A0A1W1UV24_9BACT|nr:N-acetylmuramoyl-L-alanine amidase [Hymenobacter roseosalivarius]SMB84876.1 cell wall hydrolase/autolysin [Hymenobacter roseosalivarius DSM 11622]
MGIPKLLLRLLLLLQVTTALAQLSPIETAETVPAADQWLQPGDRLQVRLKGQPGATATFLGGKSMNELSPMLTNGQLGIYQGTYVVQPGDTLFDRLIAFELLTADSMRTVAFSQNTVRFLNQNAPQLAVTKGPLAYLNYGLGEDRLGGAKMGYLDSLVVLNINGKVGNQYRVRLAENQIAWVPENSVRLLPPGGFMPGSLTGSWSVQGDSLYDYVRVPLTERLPYRSQLLTEPTRLVIDVFGATSNTNWITQRAGLQALGDVHYEQVQPDVFRLVLHLRHRQSWGYSIGYQNNVLTIRVKRPPAKMHLRGLTVAVDAGHGGTNTGAVGASGAREKDLTLAIAQRLRRKLEHKGARVLMTRDADLSVDNGDRILRLRQANPDLLVSIHVNSSSSKTVRGTSTYYRYVAFRPLSTAIYAEMLRTGLPGFGNVGSFNFGLNGPTEYPNALVETAFVSNSDDERLLTSPEFQQRMAEHITRGLTNFLRNSRQPGLRGWLSRRPAAQ